MTPFKYLTISKTPITEETFQNVKITIDDKFKLMFTNLLNHVCTLLKHRYVLTGKNGEFKFTKNELFYPLDYKSLIDTIDNILNSNKPLFSTVFSTPITINGKTVYINIRQDALYCMIGKEIRKCIYSPYESLRTYPLNENKIRTMQELIVRAYTTLIEEEIKKAFNQITSGTPFSVENFALHNILQTNQQS